MRAFVVGVTLALWGGAAFAQVSTNCTSLVRGQVNCNTYDWDAANREASAGAAALGAAFGNAMRARKDRKDAAEATAAQTACMTDGSVLREAIASHQRCVTRESARLEASGASPQEVAQVAAASCDVQRSEVLSQARLCRFGDMQEAVDGQARQIAMRTVMETRIRRTSEQMHSVRP